MKRNNSQNQPKSNSSHDPFDTGIFFGTVYNVEDPSQHAQVVIKDGECHVTDLNFDDFFADDEED